MAGSKGDAKPKRRLRSQRGNVASAGGETIVEGVGDKEDTVKEVKATPTIEVNSIQTTMKQYIVF